MIGSVHVREDFIREHHRLMPDRERSLVTCLQLMSQLNTVLTTPARLSDAVGQSRSAIKRSLRSLKKKGYINVTDDRGRLRIELQGAARADYPRAPRRRLRKPGERVTLSASYRFEILQRDGFACVYCGRKPPNVELQVDHKAPVAMGGSDDPENLVAACRDCNLGKGARADT